MRGSGTMPFIFTSGSTVTSLDAASTVTTAISACMKSSSLWSRPLPPKMKRRWPMMATEAPTRGSVSTSPVVLHSSHCGSPARSTVRNSFSSVPLLSPPNMKSFLPETTTPPTP